MARNGEKKKAGEEDGGPERWTSVRGLWHRTGVRVLAQVSIGVGVGAALVFVLRELEGYVETRGPANPPVQLTLCDVPEPYRGRPAREVLTEAQAVASTGWADHALVERIGRRIAPVGWVKRVQRVEKLYDGRVLIRCEFRVPVAMVESKRKYYLVDEEAVRLPGEYVQDPQYRLVTGVASKAPEPGQRWPGEDLQAALAMLNLLRKEVFWKQISAVCVTNFQGRVDPRATHMELVTTAAGPGRVAGRIRWGSAPGEEIEEPMPEEKLAILRVNYARHARIDCNQMWIDVSAKRGSFLYPDSASAAAPESGDRP